MYPHVIQFETRRFEIERQVQLEEERRRARASSRAVLPRKPVLTRLVPRLADRGNS
jgi:hypothetical protein